MRSVWRTWAPPAWPAQWAAWWRCSQTAPASCSCSAPQRALLASVWPLGTGAGTQVSSLRFLGPTALAPWQTTLVIRVFFWSLAEQWSSGLREPLIKRTRVLPTGLFLKGQGMGLQQGVAIGRPESSVPLLSDDILKIRVLKANYSLGSQREIVCACQFSEAVPLMWPMCLNGSLLQLLSVSGPEECACLSVHPGPSLRAGSRPPTQSWLLRVRFSGTLALRPWRSQKEHLVAYGVKCLALFFTFLLRKRMYLGSRIPDGDWHHLSV